MPSESIERIFGGKDGEIKEVMSYATSNGGFNFLEGMTFTVKAFGGFLSEKNEGIVLASTGQVDHSGVDAHWQPIHTVKGGGSMDLFSSGEENFGLGDEGGVDWFDGIGHNPLLHLYYGGGILHGRGGNGIFISWNIGLVCIAACLKGLIM
jgi:hypothetical protein